MVTCDGERYEDLLMHILYHWKHKTSPFFNFLWCWGEKGYFRFPVVTESQLSRVLNASPELAQSRHSQAESVGQDHLDSGCEDLQ